MRTRLAAMYAHRSSVLSRLSALPGRVHRMLRASSRIVQQPDGTLAKTVVAPLGDLQSISR